MNWAISHISISQLTTLIIFSHFPFLILKSGIYGGQVSFELS